MIAEIDGDEEFKVYRYRFWIAFIYYLADIGNTIQGATFTAIAPTLT